MTERTNSDSTFSGYQPQVIEPRRQAVWREREAFRTLIPAEGQPSRYIKPSAPFTSGNIHIGHVRSYSIGDAYARFWRARGEAVLFAFGFDAFGLPAELGAIANQESPSEWVKRCAQHMTGQLKRLGFSFDWERTFMSSDAVMYRWSQWLFLALLDAGLVYRGTGSVDWCENCQTTLATIQVENGTCWRCHNPVRLIQRPQWYLRISAYLQENDQRLSELAANGRWDENALSSQRFVLGRVDGVEFDLRAADGTTLTVFTAHPEDLAAARFVAISPKHPDVERWTGEGEVGERLEELRSGGLDRADRDAEAMPLIDTGRTLPSPVGAAQLPVIVSPMVDGRFGATAVLGIPERDRTDAVIAERLLGASFVQEQIEDPPNVPRIQTRAAVRYRANDFTISRQRSWGTPIPIVYCEKCGTVPIPREQLPVILPLEIRPTGTGNPLAELDEFVHTSCPNCAGNARRETDTLDCHFDALWLWVPVCVPPNERERTLEDILALDDLRRWLPCERVVAGSDSGNFVFDQRTVTKALRDIGPLAFLADGEPFAGCLFHEMVIRDGRKMSKHLGNVVDPDELIDKYGADTVRLALMYAARPQKSLNWSDSAVAHCHRFLGQLWRYSQAKFAIDADELDDSDAANTEHLRLRLSKWCQAGLEKITEDMESLEVHSAVRNVMRLFERIKGFESRVLSKRAQLSGEDLEALLEALGLLIRVLSPFAPHIAQELWICSGGQDTQTDLPWPRPSELPA
ncbi:MAG TPA: class I tRNA ligase family protein [Solirubrobacteraceae bacterium]|jgi:leucyl-tRNA synthetase